jgi:hypothetical protein
MFLSPQPIQRWHIPRQQQVRQANFDGGEVPTDIKTGYPIAVTPLGTLKYNNRPFGLCSVSKAGREDFLLHFLTAFETQFPGRPVPNLRSD